MSDLTLSASPLVVSIGCETITLSLGAIIAVGGGGASSSAFVSLTASQAIAAGANGTHYNNTGAAVSVLATLPPALPGLLFPFCVSTALPFGIAPVGSDVIKLDDIIADATKQMQSSVEGAVLDLACHKAGTWIVTNIRREWALEDAV